MVARPLAPAADRPPRYARAGWVTWTGGVEDQRRTHSRGYCEYGRVPVVIGRLGMCAGLISPICVVGTVGLVVSVPFVDVFVKVRQD